jgi:hypothetical protein
MNHEKSSIGTEHLINLDSRSKPAASGSTVSLECHYRGVKVKATHPLQHTGLHCPPESRHTFDDANSQTHRAIRQLSTKPVNLASATTEDVCNGALSTGFAQINNGVPTLRRPPTLQKPLQKTHKEGTQRDPEPKSSLITPAARPKDFRRKTFASGNSANRKVFKAFVVDDNRPWTPIDTIDVTAESLPMPTIAHAEYLPEAEAATAPVSLSAAGAKQKLKKATPVLHEFSTASVDGNGKVLTKDRSRSDFRFVSQTF